MATDNEYLRLIERSLAATAPPPGGAASESTLQSISDALTKGQQLAAASLSVVIASDQSAVRTLSKTSTLQFQDQVLAPGTSFTIAGQPARSGCFVCVPFVFAFAAGEIQVTFGTTGGGGLLTPTNRQFFLPFNWVGDVSLTAPQGNPAALTARVVWVS